MSRKNTRSSGRRPQARRRYDGLPPAKHSQHLAPIPIEKMVVPVGKCFHRSRNGKLRFTKDQVGEALKQAQHNRAIKGSGHAEKRYYLCDETGGCGDYHLTSRDEYTARPQS